MNQSTTQNVSFKQFDPIRPCEYRLKLDPTNRTNDPTSIPKYSKPSPTSQGSKASSLTPTPSHLHDPTGSKQENFGESRGKCCICSYPMPTSTP